MKILADKCFHACVGHSPELAFVTNVTSGEQNLESPNNARRAQKESVMTTQTIETAPTMMDKPHQPQPPRATGGRWIWIVGGLAAIAILVAALVLALVRNVALQDQLASCNALAAKRVTETNEMARQMGTAARLSLAKLDEEEDPEPAAPPVIKDQPVGTDTGTDALKHEGTEKWP